MHAECQAARVASMREMCRNLAALVVHGRGAVSPPTERTTQSVAQIALKRESDEPPHDPASPWRGQLFPRGLAFAGTRELEALQAVDQRST